MRCYGSTNTHTAPPAPQRSKVTEGAGQRSNTQRTSIMYRSIRNSHIQAQYLTTTKLKSSNSRGCPGEMCEFRIDRFNEPNWNSGKLNSRRLLASGLIYDASGGPGSAVHAHGLLAASHMVCLRPMPLLCVLSAAPPSHSLSGKSIVLAMSLITYSRSMSTVCVTTMFCRMFCLARGWPTVRRCLSPEFTLFPTEARPAESCFALSVSFVSQWDSSSSVLARTWRDGLIVPSPERLIFACKWFNRKRIQSSINARSPLSDSGKPRNFWALLNRRYRGSRSVVTYHSEACYCGPRSAVRYSEKAVRSPQCDVAKKWVMPRRQPC